MGPGMRLPHASSGVWAIGFLTLAATLALHASTFLFPVLLYDDFQILTASKNWPAARANLWIPANEHAMPLGRLSTWLLIRIAGNPTRFPFAAAAQGLLALLTGLILVHLLVGRELGGWFYGLAAMILFGVSSVYQQAVTWFAASFSVIAMDFLLLALLAAQQWTFTRKPRYLLLAAVWCVLAPCWFASGILAGPMCFLYLLRSQPIGGWTKKGVFQTLVPVMGTMIFLGISLPLTAHFILHLEHYEGLSAWESFGPLTGLMFTGRSLVDNLALGLLGIRGVSLSLPFVGMGLALMAVGEIAWWRKTAFITGQRRLMIVGLILGLISYWLVYSARANWSYEGVMTEARWSRYHLLPQLGLAMFICAGLPRWHGWWEEGAKNGLSPRQTKALLAALVLLLVCQLPRGISEQRWRDPVPQMNALRDIEHMDSRCEELGISSADAILVLEPLVIPHAPESVNGWELLQGSNRLQPRGLDEVRRLLESQKSPLPRLPGS